MKAFKNDTTKSNIAARIKEELMILENESVEANGIFLKPSQCYHFETDPPHVLFNTNCPSSLKERIQSIISKYLDQV
jgi:hypothetical protein